MAYGHFWIERSRSEDSQDPWLSSQPLIHSVRTVLRRSAHAGGSSRSRDRLVVDSTGQSAPYGMPQVRTGLFNRRVPICVPDAGLGGVSARSQSRLAEIRPETRDKSDLPFFACLSGCCARFQCCGACRGTPASGMFSRPPAPADHALTSGNAIADPGALPLRQSLHGGRGSAPPDVRIRHGRMSARDGVLLRNGTAERLRVQERG